MSKNEPTYPRINQAAMKKNHPFFPIYLKELKPYIEQRYLDYTINPNANPDTIIEDRFSFFDLICTCHENKPFETNWRYMASRANGSTGICMICNIENSRTEKGKSKIKLAKHIDEDMRAHKRHPAKLIDPRFAGNDVIHHKENVLIECVECGWNHDRVSPSNFFSPEPHTDKTYRCTGCVHLGKYGEHGGATDALKKKFLDHGFVLTTELSKGDNPEKLSRTTCTTCGTSIIHHNRNTLARMQGGEKYECPHCKKVRDYNHARDMVQEKGYILLTPFEEFLGRIHQGVNVIYDFICIEDKHRIHRALTSFAKTNGCPECKKEKNNEESMKIFKAEVERRGGSVVPGKTMSNRTDKIECICTHQHTFRTSFEELFGKGKWCRACSRRVGERMANIIIEHLLDCPGKFISQRPDILKNPETGNNLELDGYNESAGLAFEYGVEGDYAHKTDKQVERDRLKVELCKKARVTLIKIPEFSSYGKVERNVKKVMSILKKNKIRIVNSDTNVDVSDAYLGTKGINDLNSLVEERSATLLSKEYRGLHEEATIQCRNHKHDPFTRTVAHILYSDGWCLECKAEEREKEKNAKDKKEFELKAKSLKEDNGLVLDEPLDIFKDSETPMRFLCKRTHIVYLSLLEIRRKTLGNISFCPECASQERIVKKWVGDLEAHRNFEHITDKYIELKNRFKIMLDGPIAGSGPIIVVCNGENTHRLKTERYNFNRNVRENYWVCKECELESYSNFIQEVLSEKAKYIGTKSGKHYWNCGQGEGHEDFCATPSEIREKGKQTCCPTCFPRINAKKTSKQIMEKATLLHKEYSGCDKPPQVIGSDVEFKSTASIPYKCCHEEHLPFFVSYDNMRGKELWCPECKRRKPSKDQIEKVRKLLKLDELPDEIRKLIVRKLGDIK